jgi:hypothetical protein
MTRENFIKLLEDLEKDVDKVLEVAEEEARPPHSYLQMAAVLAIMAGRLQGALVLLREDKK